jgi:hypothetical protein
MTRIEVIQEEAVVLVSLRECKECPLIRIENNKPTCMFSDENEEGECQILTMK